MSYLLRDQRSGIEAPIPECNIAEILLRLHGGGFTEEQTAAAIEARHRLDAGLPIERNGVVLTKE